MKDESGESMQPMVTLIYRLRRREEAAEDDVATSTAGTQTDVDSSADTESFEMAELREEVVGTVLLHPAPTPSPACKPPPPQPGPSSTRTVDVHRTTVETSRVTAVDARRTAAAAAGPPASSAAATLAVTEQPAELRRLTTEEIAMRLHSHGTGARNVQPG